MFVSVYPVPTACLQYLDASPILFTVLRSAVQYLSSWRERYGRARLRRYALIEHESGRLFAFTHILYNTKRYE